MNITIFITGLLSFNFLSIFISSFLALLSKKPIWHQFIHYIFTISSICGVIGSVLAFYNGITFHTNLNDIFVIHFDNITYIFVFLLNIISIFVNIFASDYILHHKNDYYLPILTFCTGFFLMSMLGTIIASNALSFILMWELMSISSFFLVISDKKEESIKAALFYLGMTQLGAAAIITGFAILTNGQFLIDFKNISQEILGIQAIISASLLFFGFGSKAGLVPFHVWLPKAHPQAPSHISALMSGMMLKIAIYAVLRFLPFFISNLSLTSGIIVIFFGLLSMFFGIVFAAIEKDIKVLFAFSSIENIGLIFTNIGLYILFYTNNLIQIANTFYALTLFFVFSHAIFKTGLFLSSGVIVNAIKSRSLEKMGGLATKMPIFSGIFLILVLSASALPPFSMFFGELFFIDSILKNIISMNISIRVILLITLITIGIVTGLAIFTYIKLFGISMLANPRSKEAEKSKEPHIINNISIGLLAFLCILIGLFPNNILQIFASLTNSDFNNTIISQSFGFYCIIFVLFAYIIRLILSNKKLERMYHTWDCGQEIDSSMEYTATAFSAPIRFFFRPFLLIKKEIKTVPRLSSNPWISDRSCTVISGESFFTKYLYKPVISLTLFIANNVKKIQSGVIQFYLSLIFITLIICLLINSL